MLLTSAQNEPYLEPGFIQVHFGLQFYLLDNPIHQWKARVILFILSVPTVTWIQRNQLVTFISARERLLKHQTTYLCKVPAILCETKGRDAAEFTLQASHFLCSCWSLSNGDQLSFQEAHLATIVILRVLLTILQVCMTAYFILTFSERQILTRL